MAAAAFVARLLPSETDVPVTPGMNPEEEKLLEAEEQHEVARQTFCRRKLPRCTDSCGLGRSVARSVMSRQVEFTSISFAMSVLVLCLLQRLPIVGAG